MKIAFIFLFVSFLQVSAKSSGQKITLSVKNAPLEEVFTSLREQSDYNFLYDPDVLSHTHTVSFTVKNTALKEVLIQCFKDQPVNYVITQNNVVIKEIHQQNAFNILVKQGIRITGVVTDDKGLPLPGVSVIVKGTTTGGLTDKDGKYEINVPNGNVTLIFSFIGTVKKEVELNGRSVVDVTMIQQPSSLNEVVVIGYGTQSQKNSSGAIAKLKAENLNFAVSPNFQAALEGKVAGLQVSQPSGQPGAFVPVKIRSNPSPNANQGVLYVLDGVPINDAPGVPGGNSYYGSGNVSQSIYNSINPNDIESIDVLKDASAAAIYGARAGGGVILITTKKGRTGKATIDYSGSQSFQNAVKVIPQFNGQEYENARNSYLYQKYLATNGIGPYFGTADAAMVAQTNPFVPYYTQAQIDAANTTGKTAMQQVLRSGYTNQQNLTISKGDGKTAYVISGNYFDQRGTIIGTGITRYNGRVRIDENVSAKLKVGINVIGSNSNTANSVYGGTYEHAGIVEAAQQWPGNQSLTNSDGSYPTNKAAGSSPNPLTFQLNNDHTLSTRLFSSGTIAYTIINDLKAEALFSYDQQNAKRSVYFPTTFLYGGQNNLGGSASINENSSKSTLIDYTISYKHIFAQKHNVSAVAGYSYNKAAFEGFGAGNTTFFSNIVQYYNLGAGQSNKPSVSSYQNENTWASYFARVIYTYDGNLTIQSSIRRDGNTAFAENKKWGYFPSVSASYVLFDNPDLTKNSKVNLLKIRLGYGETGNSPTGGSAFSQYRPGLSPTFGTGTSSTGVFLSQTENPNLTWETAAELNAGLDYSLFNDRISGSIDVFSKTIRNLITSIPFPTDFVVSSYIGNAGTTRDRGYELLVNTRNIVPKEAGGFSWKSSFTFSHYYDYWVKRSDASLLTLPKYVTATGPNAAYSAIYGYQSDGLFTGKYGTAPSTMPGLYPGGLIIRDIHGYDANGNLTGPDGQISAADQMLIGNSAPKFNFSVGNTFSYKNLALSIFFTGQQLKEFAPYQYALQSLYDVVGQGWNTYYPLTNQRWTTQNPTSTIPSGLVDPKYSNYQGNGSSVSYYLLNATFLRCQDIGLNYTVPDKLLGDKKVVRRLGISFNVNNAFVITKYPYVDPQIDLGNFYPLSRSFTIGINAGF